MPTALELFRELLRHELCVEGRASDLLYFDLWIVELELTFDGLRQALDRPALPPDDEARSLREQRDAGPHGSPLDVEAAEPGPAGLAHQVFLEEDAAHVLDDDPLVFPLDFRPRH